MNGTPRTDKILQDATIAARAGDSLPVLTAILKHARNIERELNTHNKARIAYRFYVCASDKELADLSMTREQALRNAYEADDAARTFLANIRSQPHAEDNA